MNTVQRITSLFESSGKSKRSILLELGFSPTALAEWNRGKAKPTVEAITTLAKYFGVTTDYLLCLTDAPAPLNLEQEKRSLPAERPETALATEMPDLFKEQRFVDTAKVYNELPDEYREKAYGLILGIALGIGLNVDKILGR